MHVASGTPTDASSLIYLAKAGGLAPAFACLGVLLLSPSVWREVIATGEQRGAPEMGAIRTAIQKQQIAECPLDTRARHRAARLQETLRLDAGECEVLVLGASNAAILVDERRATKAALAMGLHVVPAIAVPELALRMGALGRAEALALVNAIAIASSARAELVAEVARMIEEGAP